ncbi:chromosome segregation protein SMC [Aquibacillus sp. 3ASR75-11]|uniref:Chromosome partition protein Smc n=1 Tax=Terrihalobacillus insolitus TaxID=2950438 RepID=A0A9X4AKS0_9BACI|nr:chromosome segregation protein SMC [Terrihalobacillus insolitus]MDC3412915.1 chromosome segregation protein SMC [Terrihalobacillus insolitus]MDC3423607.1 chromosome segregation protein SMC [Terrihalobacillus insolitus]
MFLKRLESVGFKSFAERISVEFVPGVTAVVGPNGSGKSNITDAIRWVLGEQSAKSLRGSKMEDIIFQGSDSRKALNVADVTLTLDNSCKTLPVDFEEVSVTRRVYRSGESEFLINKQPCRLKDIIDLFLDSGLGREAFSIISQGKVEEILSSKPEERRSIFEEAAGVLKYKQRKKKAEYKLAETQENLNRIEDIIFEIEGQLDPLKEQAAIAEDYLIKKEELKEKEISLLIAEIETLHSQWQQLLREIDNEREQEMQLKTRVQQQDASIENERSALHELDQSIEKLQERLLVLTQELENLEGNRKLINERFRHFEQNRSKLEHEQEELTQREASLLSELVIEKAKLDECVQQMKKTKKQADEIANKLHQADGGMDNDIEELKSEYIDRLNDQAATRNERQSLAKQLEQIAFKRNRQREKFEEIIHDRDQIKTALASLYQTLDERKRKRQEAEQIFHQEKLRLEKDNESYQEAQTKLYKGYQYIEKIKSKKEMLEEMKEDFQGFFQGVKEILKAREDKVLFNIEGAVIELIQVPNDYISAIETALGGQAQHIVVKDEATARNAIQWLKKNNKGRATFLPLSTIQAKQISKDLLNGIWNIEGFVGVASDLVEFESKYQQAIKHILGNVIIAKNLKSANEIAARLHRRFRVVTLDGDVVNPGGSMAGGAKKKTNQSLFTREKDLNEVTEKLTEFEAKAEQFERKVTKLKQAIKTQEDKLEEQRSLINDKVQQEQESQAKVSELEIKLSHVSENLSVYDQDNEQFEKDSDSLKQRDLELSEVLIRLENELAEIQHQMDTLTAQQTENRQNKSQLQTKHHELEVTLAQQDARVKNQQEKTRTLEAGIEEVKQALHDNQEQWDQLIQLNESEATEEELAVQIEEKQSDKDHVTSLIQSTRQERYNRSQKMQDQEREMKEQNRLHHSLLQALQDKEVKANRLDVELENRLSHLQTEYLLTFEKAKNTFQKAEDLDEAKRSVRLIKRAIDELGTVNIGAIDEYKRIEERYQFLSEQKDDLVQAKATLYDVISEMDGEMTRKFDETFSKIKEEFRIVFQELFGGGKAELKLTAPENLLDTGVDIIAQPPGKKLQHLGLLSGGERALTAIALLFAILRVRPVPFCVLDEVEAALDEANVNRFARYVKMFSEKTQFIVITHRKGTMEEADVLYGVTMQESGVSRMVSVRFEDTAELVKS